MSIRVRYFASLREKMGQAEQSLAFVGISTIADVWNAASGGQPFPDRTLCALNMNYAPLDSPVQDGDEVAFFPPVTGG
jgi:molybdopterin synthase sulfur carrier subunit